MATRQSLLEDEDTKMLLFSFPGAYNAMLLVSNIFFSCFVLFGRNQFMLKASIFIAMQLSLSARFEALLKATAQGLLTWILL